MHPLEKHLLKTLAEFDTSALPHDAAGDSGYTINVKFADSLNSRIAACKVVDTLHATGILKGDTTDTRLSSLNSSDEPMVLQENATIIPNADSQKNLMLRMHFKNETPAEVHKKIANLLLEIQKTDNEPSALQPVESAIKSTFKAAGLPLDDVQAMQNEVVVTFKEGTVPVEKIRELSGVMRDAGLLKFNNVKSLPLFSQGEGGAEALHLPFPDKSVGEVQEGFFNAETLLRRREQKRLNWTERVNKSTYVSGADVGKQ